jgi:hypothetical protein
LPSDRREGSSPSVPISSIRLIRIIKTLSAMFKNVMHQILHVRFVLHHFLNQQLQGFTPHRQYCSRPINKPLSCRNNLKLKENQFNSNHGDRFDQLSKNPQIDQIDGKSITEAITILQAENKGLVNNVRKPNLKNGDPNLDFITDGPAPYKFIDEKNPIDISKFSPPNKTLESFNKMAKKMGEKITKQKGGSNDVLHIVDLEKLPSEMKANFTQKVTESAGSANGIEFIN